MKKYRNLKNVLKRYFEEIEREYPVEVRYFDYRVFDKAESLLKELTKTIEKNIFKNNRYLFHYYVVFKSPFRKEFIILNIPVYIGEEVNTYVEDLIVKTDDFELTLKNRHSSLFIAVFEEDLKNKKYKWEKWDKVKETFEEISRKENLEVYFSKGYDYKFASIEIPVESYVVYYTI